jgi:hypothetical protein
MAMADEFSSADEHRRRSRRRSPRSRAMRKVRDRWRRAKLSKAILTLVLAAGAIAGGYKATMYLIGHQLDTEQFRTSAN